MSPLALSHLCPLTNAMVQRSLMQHLRCSYLALRMNPLRYFDRCLCVTTCTSRIGRWQCYLLPLSHTSSLTNGSKIFNAAFALFLLSPLRYFDRCHYVTTCTSRVGRWQCYLLPLSHTSSLQNASKVFNAAFALFLFGTYSESSQIF